MVPDEGESTPALWSMASLATPMAIRVAATLRLADYLLQGRRSASELAAAVNVDADALDRVLRHLDTVGVLTRDESGQYALTERANALRDDHPSHLRAALDLEGAVGRADLAFAQLLHTVRTGEPGFPLQFGRSFWDDLTSDATRSASFDSQMGADVAAWAPTILSSYDWGSLGHVVDVGGGNGSLLIALLTKYPALRGTVVDLPGTAAAARLRFMEAGLDDRGEVVAGSFFDPLPTGAGGYLLTAIVHDWDDEPAAAILRRCADAATPNGKVFVVEKIGTDGVSPGTDMDLRLLTYFGGRERDLTELIALSEHSGLRLTAVHTEAAISILELTPC
jgi:hypothetical protein